MTQEEIQKEAIKTWYLTKKGTIVLPTGVGKTYVGITIAGIQLQFSKIKSALVIVPTTNLKQQWKNEFEKWGYSLKGVRIECVQTARKIRDHYDLVIIDEIHTSLSKVNRGVFDIPRNQLVGFTATIPEDRELLDTVCPVVYTREVKQVMEDEIISKVKVFNIECSFNKTDKAKYKVFNSQFNRAAMELGILKKHFGLEEAVFDIAKQYSASKLDFPIVKWSRQFWGAMTMRKAVCYNSESKIDLAVEIINYFPSKKWILFNKSINIAEKLKNKLPNAVIYHSKQSTEDREESLRKFSDSSSNILIAVDALNAGLNVPDANAAICLSGVSKELVGVQQLGRIGRKHGNKIGLFFNLYTKGTVEERWTKSRTKSLNPAWIKSVKQCAAYRSSKDIYSH